MYLAKNATAGVRSPIYALAYLVGVCFVGVASNF